MTLKFLEELSNDYDKLFETKIGYDVIIYAGDEQNIKEIHAHSNILCIRSKYFRTAFSNEWAEKEDGKFIFRKPNISPHLFNIILRFIYSGNIELKNLQGSDVFKLLIAVDELNIQQLIPHIQEYLIKHQTEFLCQNLIDILEIIYQHETFTDLWNFCLKEPKILFNSDKFINLKSSLLELLLKRDDLNMDEIEVWEGLLKYCFAQQNIDNDPIKWSKDDITKIERSLSRFIPLIRFYDIEPRDFFYKVYNYKDVLPQNLIHDLLEFHIVPNMKPKTDVSSPRKPNLKFELDSTLIQSNYIPLFASWIDRKDSSHYNNKDIPYDFKLLYHLSGQDEFNAATFHINCDNKGPFIWIAKIRGSSQLIGGYNEYNLHDWSVNDRNDFLFSFTNGKNISTANLSYIKFSGHDFIWSVGDNYLDVIDNYFPNINIPSGFNFILDNYEVFQVIKK
ncbi:hypothetical protein C1646_801684 [Rhizophagus diaphanus]|nr:hypothetical protein C1646_801684 [Rhizophagus diaphanus] [Rhizophagus sp. MUCL 43196]